MKDDSNDTKNETEKRILLFFLIGQSFLKIFAGAGAKLAGRRLSRNELRTEIIKLILSWEFRSFNFVYGNLFIYFSGQFCSTENRMTVSKIRVPT